MCKKSEEIALVKALTDFSGRDKCSIRCLLAGCVRLIKDTCRARKLPIPQHLVEEACITFTVYFKSVETPYELAVKTMDFLSKGSIAPFNIS